MVVEDVVREYHEAVKAYDKAQTPDTQARLDTATRMLRETRQAILREAHARIEKRVEAQAPILKKQSTKGLTRKEYAEEIECYRTLMKLVEESRMRKKALRQVMKG
jgi:uncharacterized membrane protein YgcG